MSTSRVPEDSVALYRISRAARGGLANTSLIRPMKHPAMPLLCGRLQQCTGQIAVDGDLSGTVCYQEDSPRVRAIIDRIAIAPVVYYRYLHGELIRKRCRAFVR